MGQLFFTDETGRRWMCGWDNPSQGYYASRENDEERDPCELCAGGDWEEFDVLIGFGIGLPLDLLYAQMEKAGFQLTAEQLELLRKDHARDERPLTPLQKNVHAMFEGLL
jgi:hypothetical protein